MATLYELTAEYKELLGMDYEFEDKADGYAKVLRSLDGKEEAISSEIKRLTEMKRVVANNKKAIKQNLENAMIETGKTKFKTTLFSFGIQKNPASVRIKDESLVPEEYRIKQPDKIDKKGLIKALKEGAVFTENIELVQTESLRIR